MVIELVALPVIFTYVALGASVHVIWGIYKAYTTFISLKIKWSRIFVEFVASIFFGLFGAFALPAEWASLPLGLGVESVGMFSAILGAYVISAIFKKFRISKFEVIVSDQQLQADLNPRQVNALQVAQKFGKITNKTHQRVNATTRHIANRDLNKLVLEGTLRRVGRGKGTYYVPARYAPHMPRENVRNQMGHK